MVQFHRRQSDLKARLVQKDPQFPGVQLDPKVQSGPKGHSHPSHPSRRWRPKDQLDQSRLLNRLGRRGQLDLWVQFHQRQLDPSRR